MGRSMRILHLDNGREMRGGQWQVLALMEGLRDRGVAQRLLARPGSPLESAARASGLEVAAFEWRRLWSWGRWATLVHAHDSASHSRAALLGLAPLVVARRVAFPIGQDFLTRRKYRRARLYLAVSRHVASLLASAGIPENRVRVVYDGVPLAERLSEGSAVVALSSADPGKRNDLLREAAEAGGFPVHFSHDLPTDLQQAGVFVYLSESEGLGSAALLAMSAGVPVVASRLPALAEIVEDEYCGLLTDNTPTNVANAIQRLLRDPALASTMGRRGRTRVEERFTFRHMVEHTLAAYEEIL
jgi:glycosyltransferase involved in cell wall biosynthesis